MYQVVWLHARQEAVGSDMQGKAGLGMQSLGSKKSVQQLASANDSRSSAWVGSCGFYL
jgi:hypothetical protein